MSGELSIQNVVKSYGEKNVLNGISFDAKRGEFIVLVGPSGCGKSTMLRSIAGLETVTSGSIKIDDKDVTEFAPKDRHIAMVFQDYALYPHKSVYENIAFGLRIRKQSESDIDAKVKVAAEKLNLMPYLDRKPGALSGGQRQRVAIGRAIVREPKIFLFDEPLSNLDAKLRGDMRVTIAKLHKDLNATIVYVTHDQVEAMTLADKIIVLDGGHIQQMGTPLNLYYHPSNVFVATFIGSPPMNLVSGSIVVDGDIKVDCGDGLVYTLPEDFQAQVKPRVKSGQKVLWGLRPENFRVEDAKSSGPVYDAVVEVTEPLGPTTSVHCRVGKHSINVMLPAPFRPEWGAKLRLELKSKHLYLFDEESQVSLVD